MKKIIAATLAALAFAVSAPAAMAHEETLIGAAIGGALGAALGHEMSGRSGAIVMGAAGSAAGAMIGGNMERPYRERVVMREDYDDYPVRHVYVVRERPVERIYYVQPARYQTVYAYRDRPHFYRHHRRHHDDD